MKSPTGWVFCLILFIAIAAHAGNAADRSSDRIFLLDLQKALRTGDRDWLAEHIHYPAMSQMGHLPGYCVAVAIP